MERTFTHHDNLVTSKKKQIILINVAKTLCIYANVELWHRARAAVWMHSWHHHSELVAMKSTFISALCWQTPLGTWTKHRQTGHKQLPLPLSICLGFRRKEKRWNSTTKPIISTMFAALHDSVYRKWSPALYTADVCVYRGMVGGAFYMSLYFGSTFF